MGQAMTSETLSISGGDGYRYLVGLTLKPFKVGCKKTMYKGVLIGNGPREWEKVVVKAFTDIPGTKEIWTHEVNKADITKQLATRFIQECSVPCKIRVVVPGIVQMDKVSNITQWLAGRGGGRGLTREEWLSVEELLPGKVRRFCPWAGHHDDHVDSDILQTFAHFTYKHTNGALVACDFQGISTSKNNTTKFIFTDSIIHSTYKLYGLFDKGEYGITEFFKFHKCTNICKEWPKPTPLTPPPSFDEACLQSFNLTPPPAFENIVFPPLSNENEPRSQERNERSSGLNRRRHASEHNPRQRHQREAADLTNTHTLHVERRVMRRRSNSNSYVPDSEDTQAVCPLPLNYFNRHIPAIPSTSAESHVAPPPAYESVCGLSSRPQASANQAGDCSASNVSNSHLQRPTVPIKSPVMPRRMGGSLKQLRHFDHEQEIPQNQTTPPHRSATDSDLDRRRDAGERFRSFSENSFQSSLQNRRLRNQRNENEGGNSPVVFTCGDMESPLPPLHTPVPSAPPLEDEDNRNT